MCCLGEWETWTTSSPWLQNCNGGNIAQDSTDPNQRQQESLRDKYYHLFNHFFLSQCDLPVSKQKYFVDKLNYFFNVKTYLWEKNERSLKMVFRSLLFCWGRERDCNHCCSSHPPRRFYFAPTRIPVQPGVQITVYSSVCSWSEITIFWNNTIKRDTPCHILLIIYIHTYLMWDPPRSTYIYTHIYFFFNSPSC